MKSVLLSIFFIIFNATGLFSKEYHVAQNGNNYAIGSADAPFQTIAYAAKVAKAGDTVTVHEGIYREHVNPINGGTSPVNRILYRVAPNEKVVIKGSEVIDNWVKYKSTTWQVVIPNSFFKDYNPYQDELEGDWLHKKDIKHHTGEVFLNGLSLFEKNNLKEVLKSEPYQDARNKESSTYTWYAEVDEANTTIWANFQGVNPNQELVEINVRKACFYPEKPGVNYITVRGFIMDQAATQWAAPTAEQVGLLGTHWSKGWIIEDNIISNSKSVGITLGKDRATGHNVWTENKEKDGATHYNEVIFKAYYSGWSKENIGSHIVRNNEVYQCGQAGIVGSLGAVFSEISNNHVHDIWIKRIFEGYEMAGIKIHAPIDMLISNNRINNTGRGMWLDWMTQGTRVTRNLFYDNTTDDLFVEVNHGPFLIDNNIFLSDMAIRDWSEGGAFVHNLISGHIMAKKVLDRTTPYHFPHSTKVLGVKNIEGGDQRYYNNLFLGIGDTEEKIEEKRVIIYGLHGYTMPKLPTYASGNIYYHKARALESETNKVVNADIQPVCEIEEKGGNVILKLKVDSFPLESTTEIITTEILGSTFISDGFYEKPDGKPYTIGVDFFENKRSEIAPTPGPFEKLKPGDNTLKIW